MRETWSAIEVDSYSMFNHPGIDSGDELHLTDGMEYHVKSRVYYIYIYTLCIYIYYVDIYIYIHTMYIYIYN